MSARGMQDFTPVAATSDYSPTGSVSDGDGVLSKLSVGRVLCGFALVCTLVLGTCGLTSVYRGRVAADAALQGYLALSLEELNPKVMEDKFNSEIAERLRERAGRSEDLSDNELLISIDEAITKARLGHFGRAKMQDATRNATNNSKPNATTAETSTTGATTAGTTTAVTSTTEASTVGSTTAATSTSSDPNQGSIGTEFPTPYPTQSPEEIEHVINELIMTKLNDFLSTQQTNLNAAMPGIIGPQMKHAKFPQSSKQKIDHLFGLESMYIDTMECTSVDSDLATGTALAHFRIYATTDPLTVKARARLGNSGSYYHITLRVYGFYISAGPTATIDFKTQALTAVKVGWIETGCDRLEGTCYSKSNPNQRDSLCTAVLNKRLRKEKHGMFRQLSASLSSQAQKAANKLVPFKLPQPPTPTPTSAAPTMNTTAALVATEL